MHAHVLFCISIVLQIFEIISGLRQCLKDVASNFSNQKFAKTDQAHMHTCTRPAHYIHHIVYLKKISEIIYSVVPVFERRS